MTLSVVSAYISNELTKSHCCSQQGLLCVRSAFGFWHEQFEYAKFKGGAWKTPFLNKSGRGLDGVLPTSSLPPGEESSGSSIDRFTALIVCTTLAEPQPIELTCRLHNLAQLGAVILATS